MTSTTYRGIVQDGAIVFLDGSVPLKNGTEVLITPLAPARGTAAALMEAVAQGPQVPSEWVDELERLIEEGQRPPLRGDIF